MESRELESRELETCPELVEGLERPFPWGKRPFLHPVWYNLPMQKIKMERRGRLQDLDRSFDFQFWQNQSPQARFDATWELIVHAYRVKGHDVRQLRLQRSVTHFGRQKQ